MEVFGLRQPKLLTVFTQPLHKRLREVAVVARLAPCRQLPVGDDHNAARFVQQHDRVIKEHEVFVRQLCIHHVVYDDERTAEPEFIPLLLFGNVVFIADGIEELFNRAVTDLDVRRQRLPAEMACQRRLAGAAFSDDEQVLIDVDPRQILQLLNLPANAAVDFLRKELLARQAALMFELDVPRAVAQVGFLLQDGFEIGEVGRRSAAQVDVAAGEIIQLQLPRQLSYVLGV